MADKKILIVDDDKTTLHLLEKNLSREGYQVVTADNGQEALEQIRTSVPDFIVMDILMPDITGPDVVKQMQADAETANIPLVFLSSMIEKDDGSSEVPMDVTVGGRTYNAIGKPPSWEEILNAVENALG